MTAIAEGFVFGLGSSVHCAAMCGPLVLVAGTDRAAGFAYHTGRLAAYCAAGGALGALGTGSGLGVLREAGPWIGIVLATGLVLGALGFDRLLGALPGSARLTQLVLGHARTWSLPARTAALGAVTPLLPCGVLWTLYGSALLAGGLAAGASVALGFVLGSAPLLVLAQWQGGWLRRHLHGPRARWIVRAVLLAAAGLLLWRSLAGLQGASCCT